MTLIRIRTILKLLRIRIICVVYRRLFMKQYRSMIRSIMTSVNVIDGAYALYAKKIGLKENTLSLLYALDDGNPHSQKEICEQWLIPKTTINTVVRECVEKGYIVLVKSRPTREKEICLTSKGRKYAKQVLEPAYDLESSAIKKVLASFSPEVVLAMEQFANSLKEETEKFSIGV